ncbi:Ultraviolet-B receptor [Nymphaea thermarum]|nr:Ultraviolet-B receptor [Nymphaea thermarum]
MRKSRVGRQKSRLGYDLRERRAIIALKKGAHLLKYGRRGKPKLCHFRLSVDEKYLVWLAGNEENHVKIGSITNVIRGQVNFQQQTRPENLYQSFSLIYGNGQNSLDLSASGKVPNILIIGSYLQETERLKVHSLCGSPLVSSTGKCFSDGLQLSPRIWSLSENVPSPVMGSLTGYMLPGSHLVEPSYHAEQTSGSTKGEGCRMSLSSAVSCASNAYLVDEKDNLNDVLVWGEGIMGSILGGAPVRTCGSSGLQADSLFPKLLESAMTLDVFSISCGKNHAALVTKKGEVFCWGKESGGRLGHKIDMDVSCPKIVESLSDINVQSVKCGEFHTCALSHSGEVYMWGGFGHGLDSSDNKSNRNIWLPLKIQLEGIFISSIACGDCHTALVSSSGKLFTFGEGAFGALGHGDLKSSAQPREVQSLKGLKVKSVSCGPWHTAAIVEIHHNNSNVNPSGGKLFTWGDGDKGKLGHVDKERKLFPTCVASLAKHDFLQVSCGRAMTVSLTVSGRVFTMGSSVHGQLGNPNAKNGTIACVESALKHESVKEISSGSYHVAVLTSKGNVYTWGKGANGRLGLGDVEDRNSPSLVDGLNDRDVRSISCGSSFTAVICCHRTISRNDRSSCSGCRIGFGFTRKKHHCYNCGFTFCHACSSKKAINASLAPNKSKPYRVCGSCFVQLRSTTSAESAQETPSSEQYSLMNKLSISSLKLPKSETPFAMSQIFSPRICGHEELQRYEGKSSRHGREVELLSPFASFSSGTKRWGQVKCPKHFAAFREVSTFSISHSKKEVVAPSPSYENRWQRLIPNAAYPTFHGFEDVKKKDFTLQLIEEVQRLKVEAKNLEEQCKMKDEKIQQYKKGIKEIWSLASEEVAKCKAAKDVLKVLTARVDIPDKFACEKEINISKRLSSHMEAEISDDWSLEDNLLLPSILEHMNNKYSITYSSNDWPIGASPLDMQQHGTALVNDEEPENREHSQNGKKTLKIDDVHPPFSEWVEQDEPGVYITLMALPDGRTDLKRVRFSRKRFTEEEAEIWWAENRLNVHHKYNVVGTTNT